MLNLVSVCLLTYNHEKYIDETLNSIIGQTYKNIELIILDDASCDKTQSIIQKKMNCLLERFVSVKVLTHFTNSGNIPQNVNEMIYEASGEFIKEFAGDDVMLPNCITTLVEEAKKHPDAMVIHSNGYVEKDTFHLDEDHSWKLYRDKRSGYENENFFNQLLYSNPVLAPSALLRRCIFNKVGYYNPLIEFEDYEMWLRIAKSGEKFYFCELPLVSYRRTPTSLTTDDDNEDRQLYRIKAGIQVRKKYIDNLETAEQNKIWKYVYSMYGSWAVRIKSNKCLEMLYSEIPLDCCASYLTSNSPDIDILQAKVNVLSLWIDKYEIIENLIDKWKEEDKNIAIYGYSELGRRLFYRLVKKDAKIKYIIDRRGEAIYSEIPVYSMDDCLPPIDLIVTTIFGQTEEIKKKLICKTNAVVVNLMHFLYHHS